MKQAVILYYLGPVAINSVVVTTWGIMLLLTIFCWLATRRLSLDPGPLQTALEGMVSAIYDAIHAVLPAKAKLVLPFIGTLWVYITIANLTGLIPGLSAPTASLSTTAGLALLVFFSAHWYGIQCEGLASYLRHYLSPSPIMLPFHLISEVSRTIALAVRLFGNIMSLEMAAMLLLLVAGLLVPVPLLMLHIVEALVQAYIFGMLALMYVSGAMQSQQLEQDASDSAENGSNA